MRFSHGIVPVVLALALLTTGCRDSATASSEPKPTPAKNAAADPKASPNAVDDSPVVAGKAPKTKSPQKETGKDAEEPDKKSAPSELFEPPFAHRVDLFAPPSRGENRTVKNDEQKETIELQGFVDVDGIRAILAIDDIIAPIAEGEERFGIQVIAIQPPKVVLQRGRQRWTTTLDN